MNRSDNLALDSSRAPCPSSSVLGLERLALMATASTS